VQLRPGSISAPVRTIVTSAAAVLLSARFAKFNLTTEIAGHVNS
jgi:hypothetical protein